MPFDKKVLPNGLTVVAETIRGSPDAAILLGTNKGGAIYNPGGFHFIEHILTKRGGARTAREFSQGLDRVGIDFQAETTHQTMTITGHFKPELLGQVLKLFSKISRQDFFSEHDFEIEKGVIKVEIKRAKDSAEEFLDNLLFAHLFGNHPIAKPTMGLESEITGLSFEELQRVVRNYFNPANLILVVVGPQNTDEVFSATGEHFSSLKKRRFVCPKIKKAKIKKAIPARWIRKKIIEAAYMIWAFPVPAFSSEEYIPMLVALNILEERLFNELRNKRGLCYDVNSLYFDSVVVNFATLSVDCISENIDLVSEIVAKEFRKFKIDGVQENDFYETLNKLVKIMELSATNVQERAGYLYKSLTVGLFGCWDDALSRIRSVIFRDVKPLVKRCLRPSLVKQVILTPPIKKHTDPV